MGKRAKREQRKAERQAVADAVKAEEAAEHAQRRAQFLAELASQRCPTCGSATVSRIFYGMLRMNEELKADIAAGRVFEGGCNVSDGDPLWFCRECRAFWGSVKMPAG